jgi:hypothetical protein
MLSFAEGVDEPTPTFPLDSTVRNEALVEEATLKSVEAEPDVPCTERSADGVVVAPTARLPFWKSERSDVPVEDAIVNGLTPPVPVRENVEAGVDEPIPILPLEPILKNRVPVEEATANKLSVSPATPVMARAAEGVDEPIPMFPLDKIVNNCEPDDEATENGLIPGSACTRKEIEDEVALIPVDTPSSRRDEVPRVVGVSHREAKPSTPPDRPRPSEDVAIHCVEVPVDQRT